MKNQRQIFFTHQDLKLIYISQLRTGIQMTDTCAAQQQAVNLKLQEFVKQIEILSVMWFGGKGNHEYSIALELEEYILSKDKESRERAAVP